MNQFTFQEPVYLLLLLLIFPLVALLTHARKRRITLLRSMGGNTPTHRKLRDVLRVLAVALLCLALARPGYDPQVESLNKPGRDLVFALDVSRSMLANDLSPSRLELAKQAIRDTLPSIPNQRVGLVVYAGSSSILCPLTYDHDFLRYMLDQAHPRSVDFGGTTIQSAVEKVIDQVYLDGRKGVQDLIVLTDGGDHGSVMDRVAQALNRDEVDVLLVGLGDPSVGSPIPIQRDGQDSELTQNGKPVLTKLDDLALKQFASITPRAEYHPAGTQPFNLGHLYHDFIKDKSSQSSDMAEGAVVYQEAALWLILPAILLLLVSELWGKRGLQIGHATMLALCITPCMQTLDARELNTENRPPSFEQAATFYQNHSYEEAATEFQLLYVRMIEANQSPATLAAVQMNLGLSLRALAKSADTPKTAYQLAQQARHAFLSSARHNPQQRRHSAAIAHCSQWMDSLKTQIQELEEQEKELEEELAKIIALLEQALDAQVKLRDKVLQHRLSEPAQAQQQLTVLNTSQQAIEMIEELHQQLLEQLPPAAPPITFMSQALEHGQKLIPTLTQAHTYLLQAEQWFPASQRQTAAIETIELILKSLSGDSQKASEEGDESDLPGEDSEQFDEMNDHAQSTLSDDAKQGDLAASAAMQGLPTPNYSAEEILQEEQGNLQFRQQKRASKNAANIENDY
ncbi:VWA domain-containing protein [Rubritalea marina]|uniref:VWA domain-containing protein n=1 Tax=Rubritalea marina TaxID=361055 RepID=UPI00037DDEB3|nr:VWA domain-containing protein [Rubritalea marina]